MAKRLICCPTIDNEAGLSLRYLYVDTLSFQVEDVTAQLEKLCANLKTTCCLDNLVDYAYGTISLDDKPQVELPFDFNKLNSFELFKNTEELRLKTGSEKLLHSCLLSYYRREYDGTQQHSFFSEPSYNTVRREGVEHELTLETRTFIKKEEKEYIPETLDKGKSMAEREAEAAATQAQAELEQELAAAAAAEQKKEDKSKKRKLERQRQEAEAYREFRNQDDVRSEQYQRMRQYEEEMRCNNDYLSSQYADGNYSSLPGYIPSDVFGSSFESADNETIRCSFNHNDLFAVASRLDEFGVDYTVVQEFGYGGLSQSCICYSSEQTESALKAIEFFELEKQLYDDKLIPSSSYFNAFQLQALDFACANYIDTSYVNSGQFNGNQMYRILEAGLDGYDMSVLANPNYSPAQMDALNHFMRQGWDTAAISGSGLSMGEIADHIFREEQKHGVSDDDKFFSRHDYDNFLSYSENNYSSDYLNSYDIAHRKELYIRSEQANQNNKTQLQEYKDSIHSVYEQTQKEMNYVPSSADPEISVPPDSAAPASPLPSLNTLSDKDRQIQSPNQYSFNAKYTPTGYERADSSYGLLRRNTPTTPGNGRSTDYTGQKAPKGTPQGGYPLNARKHPLDELQVRSNFAGRAGVRIQRFGSQALHTGNQFARSSASVVFNNMVREDETGTMSTGYKASRNALLTAQIIRDLPRMYGRTVHGVSYTSNAIQGARVAFACKDGGSCAALPLRVKPWEAKISSAKVEHYNSLRKSFGIKAAQLNIKEIDKQISTCSSNLQAAKDRIVPINRQLKAELRTLHPSAKLTVEKKQLIVENRTLKTEIKALQKKTSLSVQEKVLLDKKINKKHFNERLIESKAKAIKKAGQPDAASVKKAKELLKQKKLNEAALANHGRTLKNLKRLKNQKLNFEKQLKAMNKNLKAAHAAEGRLKSLPSMLANKLVQKLYESGDLTFSGIGQATGYAMSFSHNPIVRISFSFVRNKIFTPKPNAKPKPKKDLAAKSKVNKKKVKKTTTRSPRTSSAIHSKTKKTVGIKGDKTTKQLFGQAKNIRAWIKQTSKKVVESAKAAASGIKALFAGGSSSGGAAGGAAAAGGASGGWIVLLILLVVVIIIVVVMMFSTESSASTSFIITDTETEDGRIDLTYYVDLINSNQDVLQSEINSIANGVSSVTGKEYDNVFYDYVGENNTRQLLSMTYVRFGFDIVSDKDAVQTYIEQLYNDSNIIDYAESDLYACANGCVVRSYLCYDELDDYVTTTRESLYAASDHSDSPYVGDSEDYHYGCEYESYSCMEEGHSVYNDYGCILHNAGEPMDSPGECDNYTENVYYEHIDEENTVEIIEYYCQGHCDGNHRDYYCPGHEETICYGEHQDVTITITSLGFDDIFYADSSIALDGSYIRGDAYDEKFTVTAYCSCHECCHPYDPACTGQPSKTATGTTPQANHTIAVDPAVIPLGTHVWINGKEYVAEDTGGAIEGYDIDMYFNSHQEALSWGTRNLTVYKSNVVESDSTETDTYGFVGWSEDNIELVKTVYDSLVSEDADEIYYGLEDIKSLSYGANAGDFDFSGVEFGELDVSSLTTLQKAVLSVISQNKVETKRGYCQAWVANVYMYAGTGAKESRCCANHAGEAWGVSNDWSKIQVGATVYGYSSSLYGHVGIYIGNGMVAHNIGYVKVEPLESWVKTYNGQCWGWNGADNLTGLSTYNCKPSGTFMNGKD